MQSFLNTCISVYYQLYYLFLKCYNQGRKQLTHLLKRRIYQQIHSFIIPFCLSAVTPNPLPPPTHPRINVVCSKELRVQNTTLIFGEGVGKQRGRGKVYRSVSTYLSLIVFCKVIIILDQLLMSY